MKKNQIIQGIKTSLTCLLLSAILAGCGSSDPNEPTAVAPEVEEAPAAENTPPQEETPEAGEVPEDVENPELSKQFSPQVGSDNNRKSNALLSLNPGGPGGSSNQSLRAGDILIGDEQHDLLIGGLGVDVLLGKAGDDILIGGTEDFNSNVDGDNQQADNRDRAFGDSGNDTFIWTPGDGSDAFDGGEGIDVIIFGLVGEEQDAQGNTEGAPFFAVNLPGTEGSQDFDGIFLDDNNQPIVSVSTSPGFCSVIDKLTDPASFELLDLDHIVRFSIRPIANAFDAGERTDDDGLRVGISLKNTEFVVCTQREVTENGGLANVEVIDISQGTPVVASIEDLPEYVQNLIQ